MEVHAHTHAHPKKTWKEYFWEFLMLFLAVFCGFLAENLREHKVEREREKQYIHSLIEDLSEDTIIFSEIVGELQPNVARMDSFMHLLCAPDVREHGAALYSLGRKASRGSTLAIHDRTIQQMKNSGAFRLITNEAVAKAIIEYYNQLRFIEFLHATELNEVTEYRNRATAVFHPVIFDSLVMPDNTIATPSGNPALLTYDSQTLIQLAGMVSYTKNSRVALIQSEQKMSQSAKALIKLLKEAYHLD